VCVNEYLKYREKAQQNEQAPLGKRPREMFDRQNVRFGNILRLFAF